MYMRWLSTTPHTMPYMIRSACRFSQTDYAGLLRNVRSTILLAAARIAVSSHAEVARMAPQSQHNQSSGRASGNLACLDLAQNCLSMLDM